LPDEWRDELSCRNELFTRQGDHYWRYIPPGRYTIGGWLDDEDEDNDAQASIDLPAYWIAQYPITNQQYAQFIAAGGYATEAWWTTNGWRQWRQQSERTQPWFWDDPRFNATNQPVVGVTWYEASAFAAWLNAHLADELPNGYRIRLPTEAEWETACAYDSAGNRHPYPWGDAEPTDALADFSKDWQTEGPAAIGEHAAGAAPSGAQNMVGSVWEATTSSHAGYAAASNAVVDDFASNELDVPWRGGIWRMDRTSVRCAARFRGYPFGDLNYLGFRLVLSP
jgi:formylglycine-generating enzyme required for sulfatase activity